MSNGEPRRAAGFFIYRELDGVREYLLMRSAKGGHWGVPKGHEDPEDSDIFATACRECDEETGWKDILVHTGFRHVIRYIATRAKTGETYPKEVTYFLAQAPKRPILASDEHNEVCWRSLEEAVNLLQHETLVDVLEAADAFLGGLKGE